MASLLKLDLYYQCLVLEEQFQMFFKQCGNGLVKDMVIGPCDVVKEDYDILFVDESHRLSKRKNLTGYKSFDDTSRQLGLRSI